MGGLIANATIPSHDDLQALAEDLVPPGSRLTGASVVSGFEPFVGPAEAIAHFDSGDSEVATVAEAVRARASSLGWTPDGTDELTAGEIQRWSRPEADAAVYISSSHSDDDGTIFVTHAASPMGRLITGVAFGAGAGLLVVVALPVVTRLRPQR